MPPAGLAAVKELPPVTGLPAEYKSDGSYPSTWHCLYNGKIHPLIRYGIKGAIWIGFAGAFFGMGLGGAQPMIMSLLSAKAPAGRAAEAIGVRSLIINMSQTGMPLLFGALGEALGMIPVFWAMAVCLVVSGCIARKR